MKRLLLAALVISGCAAALPWRRNPQPHAYGRADVESSAAIWQIFMLKGSFPAG